MDQHAPQEENGSAGKLSLSLKEEKQRLVVLGVDVETAANKDTKERTKRRNWYPLTRENPFLVKNWPRCLARPPKNFPSSLIQVRHRGTPKSP